MQQPIVDPPVPYTGPIHGGMHPGVMVRIQGQVPAVADRFNVNLHCGSPPSDVALHMSVRLLQNYIARNSLQAGNWGDEEDTGTLPIAPGQSFEILLLCDPDSYKIAVNGGHFAEFKHRIAFQKVSHVAIDGDVTLRLIAFEGAAPSAPPPPQYGPPSGQYGPPPGHYGPPPQGQYGPPPGPHGPPPSQYGGPGGPPKPPYMPGLPSSINMPMPAPSLTSGGMPMPIPSPLPPASMPMPSATPIPPPIAPYRPPPSSSPYPVQGYAPAYPSYQPGYQPPGYAPVCPTYVTPGNPGYAGCPGYPGYPQKKSKMKKLMKYGLPIAGVGLGAYAISHAVRRNSWSSSSSSSD